MKLHEDYETELKENLDIKGIVKALVAFANTDGGRVFVGVDDSGFIKGISIGKNTIENLTNDIASRTDPSIYPGIFIRNLDGKEVIEIVVGKSNHSLHFGDHIAYKRVGKVCKKIDATDIEKSILEKSVKSFDSRLLETYSLKDLDLDKVRKLPNISKKSYDPMSYLHSRGCIIQEKLTIGGLLLFGYNPQEELLSSYTTIVDYTLGEKSRNIIQLDGDIINQINESFNTIKRVYPPVHFIKNGSIQREELSLVPDEILREVLVNAITHRNYDDYGRRVLIKLYKDKIVVSNPANFSQDFDVSNLPNYQYSRNPILTRVLYEAGYIEEVGEGVDRILEWSKKTGIQKEAVYTLENNEIKVTLYINRPELVISQQYGLKPRQLEILKVMSDKKGYSSSELAKILEVSNDTVVKDLTEIMDYIQIEKEGSGRSIRYRWII